jgi:predicted ABC-type transport system involved in lysophospholipase L1 biosynthesis ATPase subunit
MVTHENDIAERARRIVRLRDGRIESIAEVRREALPAGG